MLDKKINDDISGLMNAQTYDISAAKKLLAAFAFAFLTAISAQVRIPLSFTPVPLTGQVFAVLLSGALLGSRFGALSQMLYLAGGAVGLPFFAGLTFGPSVLLGPTGGYILGFVPAAWIAGSLPFVRGPARRRVSGGGSGWGSKMLLAILVIYIFGALQFSFIMKAGLKETLHLAVYPFICLDIAKAVAVAVVCSGFRLSPE